MKGGKLPRGYTIIEVLIVLAVSGAMFAIAANFINGKQEKTSFQQGSNEFAARVQRVIEQVTDGQYTDVPFSCSVAGPNLAFAPGAPVQPDCVLLGKLMHFSVAPSGGGPGDPKQYEVFSLAGSRLIAGKPVTLKSEPTPFMDTTLTAIDQTLFSATKQATVPQNLYVDKMHVTATTGSLVIPVIQNPAYSIGFIQGLGNGDATNGGYQSGAQTVLMVFVKNLQNVTEPTAVTAINTLNNVHTAVSATICVTDGNRAADIIIGSSNNSQLHVEVKQRGVAVCT